MFLADLEERKACYSCNQKQVQACHDCYCVYRATWSVTGAAHKDPVSRLHLVTSCSISAEHRTLQLQCSDMCLE